uniref:Uncharacterized protein n=1 Tax=Picea glauca TaxID=3330 RepID=A0A101M2I5_PICGL|nr:hypothetical protein ABT39_MTgene3037 [Picea glauca]QHR91948.1 hypothetical protein Q903MT_gene5984 [Picea sitchensis]
MHPSWGKEEFVPPPTFCFIRVQLSILQRSSLIICQQARRKKIVNPSGLGALSGSRPKRVAKTSSSSISLPSSRLSAAVNKQEISCTLH